MSFQDHFSQLADRYAQVRPSYPAALFDYLAERCTRRQLAWDCACGNGQATLALAQRFARVVATDASERQLGSAAPGPNITYRLAAAEDSGLAAQEADLITVAQALHWFDLERFYAEAGRVLRDSGVLAVWTYGVLHLQNPQIDALVQEFYHHIIGPYWPPERRLVEDGYRGIPLPFEEFPAPAFLMQERWDRRHFLGYLSTWSATARCVAETGSDPVRALEGRLDALWTEAEERVVTWPLTLRVSRKFPGAT